MTNSRENLLKINKIDQSEHPHFFKKPPKKPAQATKSRTQSNDTQSSSNDCKEVKVNHIIDVNPLNAKKRPEPVYFTFSREHIILSLGGRLGRSG